MYWMTISLGYMLFSIRSQRNEADGNERFLKRMNILNRYRYIHLIMKGYTLSTVWERSIVLCIKHFRPADVRRRICNRWLLNALFYEMILLLVSIFFISHTVLILQLPNFTKLTLPCWKLDHTIFPPTGNL